MHIEEEAYFLGYQPSDNQMCLYSADSSLALQLSRSSSVLSEVWSK